MAVRKFIVVAGQNQATEVANSTEWEEKHLYAALRSPRNVAAQTPDFSAGPYTDIQTLPYTFKGGPQAKVDGDVTFGSHQYANLMGKAMMAVKYLTFYDPTASYQNLGTGATFTYPGTGTILAGSTSNSVNTSVSWQYDPTGITITRRRTGTTHTANAASVAGTVLTFDDTEALVPPPEANEMFDYVPTAGAAGTSSTIKLESEFGGYADPGSASDPQYSATIDTIGNHPCYVSRVRTGGSDSLGARVVCESRPVYIGQAFKFTDGATVTLANGVAANTTYYVTRKETPMEETAVSSSFSPNKITFASEHKLVHGQPVQLTLVSGSFPTPEITDPVTPQLAENTTYYIKESSGTSGAVEVQLASSKSNLNSGTVIGWDAGSGTVKLTKLDSASAFYFATTPGGAEVQLTSKLSGAGYHPTDNINNLKIRFLPTFRGSMTGMQARCLSGTASNVGEARAIHDVKYDSAINVLTTEAFPAATADGDTFAIEVPPLNNQSIPFEKWAMWLPWCPFEGKAKWDGPAEVAITSIDTAPVEITIQSTTTLVGGTPQVGNAVKLFSTVALPKPLVVGQTYIVKSVNGSTITLEDLTTDDVSGAVIGASSGTATGISMGASGHISGASSRHIMFVYDQEDKENPYPPGFNYPNHHATPRPYQAFEGPGQLSINPSISFHPSLALKMYEYTGEIMHIALCAVKSTSIGHKEVYPLTTAPTSHGWLDAGQHKSWSPGETNNCFARLEDTLDAAKLAFEADGDTGECIGIFWVQGEEDAKFEQLANNYEDSARKLRASIRKALKDRSLTTLDEDKIPFVHPKITTATNWTYASTINTAIETLASEDPYTRTFEVSTFELGSDENPKIHYSGVGMASFADSAYEAWKEMQTMQSSEVEICNLALANIGDKASVTSISPSDGSHQADLCARYYPLARDMCLERHRWDFTIRQVSPVALTASGRTDWEYAYKLPSDFAGVISVIAKDSTDDQMLESTKTPQPYAIEMNSDYDRVLYCKFEDAVLRYQAKVTDSSKFSQMFKQAVSWQLASMLAGALIKGDEGMGAVRNASQMAEFYMQKATAFDSRTTREKPVVDANTNPWDR